MNRKIFRVWLQLSDRGLHPISQNVISTARALGGGFRTQGVLFTEKLTDEGELQQSGLDEILVVEGPAFGGFCPEAQAQVLKALEPSEILLFPATPEGRTLSSMTAALLHTGVTADCTSLSFREDGRLLQVRPAFSGSRMATIVTERNPQIASLRFSMPASEPKGDTMIQRISRPDMAPYEMAWVDRVCQNREKKDLILAVGGGIRRQEDLELFSNLAEKLGGELCCSRALVDRGWMPRACQIGLSGRSIDAKTLLTFGISGSVQFQAGLGQVERLIAVDLNPQAPILGLADLPIQGDLYAIGEALLRNLSE